MLTAEEIQAIIAVVRTSISKELDLHEYYFHEGPPRLDTLMCEKALKHLESFGHKEEPTCA